MPVSPAAAVSQLEAVAAGQHPHHGDDRPTGGRSVNGVGASAAGHLAADLVEALPAEDQRLLFRLLGHLLAAPSAAALRYARLGLLIRLCADGFNGSPADYEQARASAGARGEDWPSAVAIINAYGHWHSAKRCAQRFAEKGGAARVPHNLHHSVGRQSAPTKLDCLDALRLAYRGIGDWPVSRWEYLSWAQLARRAARLAGTSAPLLPGLKQFARHGGFDAALVEARARGGRRP